MTGEHSLEVARQTRRYRVVDYIYEHAGVYPERVALTSEFESVTYLQLAKRICALAASLIDMGITRGDKVAVLTTPRSDAYSVFLAFNAIGATWVGINPVFQFQEMEYIVRDARALALFFLSDSNGRHYREDAARLMEHCPKLENLFAWTAICRLYPR